jgi:hypothetical protein
MQYNYLGYINHVEDQELYNPLKKRNYILHFLDGSNNNFPNESRISILIRRLLAVNPKERPTATEALHFLLKPEQITKPSKNPIAEKGALPRRSRHPLQEVN